MQKIYKIELNRDIEKVLMKIPRKDTLRIRESIKALQYNPRPEGVEKISDERYRVRQGDYRIIYRIYDKKLLVLIVEIGHRKEIYKKI